MKILITGAAGFMGSHLFDYLKKQGHDVWGFDNYSIGTYKAPDIFDVDLLDKEYVARRVEYFKPDVLFHLAAWAHEGLSQFCPQKITENNLTAYLNVLVPSIKAGMKRVVLTSSMAVYGDQKVPFKEGMQPRPVDIYGINKTAMEQMTFILSQVHSFEMVVIRPHNVYGPRQSLSDPYRNVVGIFINRMLKNKPFYIYGDGMQRRSFSYIDDVTPAIARAMERSVPQGVYNVGPTEDYSIEFLGIRVREHFPDAPLPEYVADRPMEVKEAYCTNEKAKKYLGYETKTTFEQGIKKTVAWAKSVGPQEFKYLEKLELENDDTPITWKEHLL